MTDLLNVWHVFVRTIFLTPDKFRFHPRMSYEPHTTNMNGTKTCTIAFNIVFNYHTASQSVNMFRK
jgi:hypothetical protein